LDESHTDCADDGGDGDDYHHAGDDDDMMNKREGSLDPTRLTLYLIEEKCGVAADFT